ncbi:hypothetical protein M3Y95_00930700 [Aphelenchoides besseyi]|nr:hypothetical protein M3Y95_00930700 [Aphelenchoides besseyi]
MASNENAKYKSKYMGRWKVTHSGNQYVFDDRFLITQQTFCKCTIVDLFHPKQKFFRFDFSSCEIEGSPSTTNEYLVRSVFAMNLGTALVLFQLSDSSSLYVGIGNIDLERSLVVVNQSTFVSTFDDTFSHAWLPLSNPPTVCKGVVLGITTYFPLRFGYFLVKMENQLTVSEVLLPLNTGFVAGFDGHLYALAYDEASNNNNANRPIDLIEIDLLKGKQNRKRTINLNVAEDVDLEMNKLKMPLL